MPAVAYFWTGIIFFKSRPDHRPQALCYTGLRMAEVSIILFSRSEMEENGGADIDEVKSHSLVRREDLLSWNDMLGFEFDRWAERL